jgi:hypothetical protein
VATVAGTNHGHHRADRESYGHGHGHCAESHSDPIVAVATLNEIARHESGWGTAWDSGSAHLDHVIHLLSIVAEVPMSHRKRKTVGCCHQCLGEDKHSTQAWERVEAEAGLVRRSLRRADQGWPLWSLQARLGQPGSG